LGGTPSEETSNGLAAAVIGIKDLGKEDPEGDERGEKTVSEGDGLVADDLLGQPLGEQFDERQCGGVGEALPELSDLAGVRRRGSMSHWMASLRFEDRCHPHSSKAGHLLLTTFADQDLRLKSVPFKTEIVFVKILCAKLIQRFLINVLAHGFPPFQLIRSTT
jgi:hypothetical protein